MPRRSAAAPPAAPKTIDEDDLTVRLVRLDTKMDGLLRSFEEVRASIAGKASAEWVTRLDARLAALEKKIWMFSGGIFAVQVLLQFMFGSKH